MRQILLVHGMKRSGNHAVINWLMALDRFVFFNNVIPAWRILRGEATVPDPVPFRRWLASRVWKQRLKSLGRADWSSLYRLAAPLGSVISSLVDMDLKTRPFIGEPLQVTHVLIVRDAPNIFASRIRKASTCNRWEVYPKHYDRFMLRAVQTWKANVREFLGLTRQLENLVTIRFDRWLTDISYRRQLAQQLSLPFCDQGLRAVSTFGGGSSFDGTRFNGQASNMNLRRRADDLPSAERGLLDQVLQDEELRKLNDALNTKGVRTL